MLLDKALLAGLAIHKSAVEVVELTNYEVVIQNDYYSTNISTAELCDCDQLQVKWKKFMGAFLHALQIITFEP